MDSKVDMSLDQIIKLNKKTTAKRGGAHRGRSIRGRSSLRGQRGGRGGTRLKANQIVNRNTPVSRIGIQSTRGTIRKKNVHSKLNRAWTAVKMARQLLATKTTVQNRGSARESLINQKGGIQLITYNPSAGRSSNKRGVSVGRGTRGVFRSNRGQNLSFTRGNRRFNMLAMDDPFLNLSRTSSNEYVNSSQNFRSKNRQFGRGSYRRGSNNGIQVKISNNRGQRDQYYPPQRSRDQEYLAQARALIRAQAEAKNQYGNNRGRRGNNRGRGRGRGFDFY